MNNEMTLFARYKNMINTMWDEGFRKYTANELNTFVGYHENSTSWKRWNNNPYYSTRLYQSLLKRLGCISMVKRGVWQINAPIPEWFSSLHLYALTNTWHCKGLEKSSTVWQSLPAEHKVNPWKSIDPMHVTASTQSTPSIQDIFTNMDNLITEFNNNTNNMTTPEFMEISIEDQVLAEVQQLRAVMVISIEKTDPAAGVFAYRKVTTTYTLNGKPLLDGTTVSHIIASFMPDNTTVTEVQNRMIDKAVQTALTQVQHTYMANKILEEKAIIDAAAKAQEKTYTESEVREILKAFIEEHAHKTVDSVADNYLGDLENNIELELSYDNRITATIDGSGIAIDIAHDVEGDLLHYAERYNLADALEGVS